MLKVVFLALAILAAVAAAPSVAAKYEYASVGFGNSSCGSWTATRRDGGAQTHQQWVVGFLSGVDFVKADEGVDPLKGVDAQAVWAWVDNYCRVHPLDYIGVAAASFVRAHPGK
jgi:hypothetical protein